MPKKPDNHESDSTPEAENDEPVGSDAFKKAAAVVRKFPIGPGVYLMKNAAGVVIYAVSYTHLTLPTILLV